MQRERGMKEERGKDKEWVGRKEEVRAGDRRRRGRKGSKKREEEEEMK